MNKVKIGYSVEGELEFSTAHAFGLTAQGQFVNSITTLTRVLISQQMISSPRITDQETEMASFAFAVPYTECCIEYSLRPYQLGEGHLLIWGMQKEKLRQTFDLITTYGGFIADHPTAEFIESSKEMMEDNLMQMEQIITIPRHPFELEMYLLANYLEGHGMTVEQSYQVAQAYVKNQAALTARLN